MLTVFIQRTSSGPKPVKLGSIVGPDKKTGNHLFALGGRAESSFTVPTAEAQKRFGWRDGEGRTGHFRAQPEGWTTNGVGYVVHASAWGLVMLSLLVLKRT